VFLLPRERIAGENARTFPQSSAIQSSSALSVQAGLTRLIRGGGFWASFARSMKKWGLIMLS